jgi:hypothetical protein
MNPWKNNNRSLKLFLAVAIALHAALILAPMTKKGIALESERRNVQVQLIAPPQHALQPPAPLVEWREPAVPILEALPAAPVAEPQPPTRVAVQQTPPVDGRRVLSSQFDYENSVQVPLFGSTEQKEDAPDFYVRQRPSLEMALNQPSLQLPFEDTRVYLVDSYDDGIMGGIDRFFDRASVPFGFTTKNNTRVQCVWMLVIAGCGWGHTSMFHRPARLREKTKKQAIENT